MNRDPRNNTEWQALAWAFCRECCGSKQRTVEDDCTSTTCHWFVVRNRPRQTVLKFDQQVIMSDIMEIAFRLSENGKAFTMNKVRDEYYHKYGTGLSLNWGAITNRAIWRNAFHSLCDVVSPNERSHGDTVKLWTAKIPAYQQEEVAA